MSLYGSTLALIVQRLRSSHWSIISSEGGQTPLPFWCRLLVPKILLNCRQKDRFVLYGPSNLTYISPLATLTDPFKCHWDKTPSAVITGSGMGGCQVDRSISCIVLKIGRSIFEDNIVLFWMILWVSIVIGGICTDDDDDNEVDGDGCWGGCEENLGSKRTAILSWLLFSLRIPVLCNTRRNSSGYMDCRWDKSLSLWEVVFGDEVEEVQLGLAA